MARQHTTSRFPPESACPPSQSAGVRIKASDFEIQEDVFCPQTAEVEARKGNVDVRCLQTDAVTVYPLGDGSDWVASFAADLGGGRFGGRPHRRQL
jgi:hypothetical protein